MEKVVFFDFDHTIIDGNSDVVIKSLAGEQGFPGNIEELSKDPNGWTEHMSLIFKYLHQQNVTEDDYRDCLSKIPLVEGMAELLKALKDRGSKVIIVSDSNSYFIESILHYHRIRDTVSKIFTNQADFDSRGCLQIKKYQEKNDCSICPNNLCKGSVLESYLCKSQIQLCYVGDGSNDLCPAIKLREMDVVYPREGHWLCKRLAKLPPEDIKCMIKPWINGYDILKSI